MEKKNIDFSFLEEIYMHQFGGKYVTTSCTCGQHIPTTSSHFLFIYFLRSVPVTFPFEMLLGEIAVRDRAVTESYGITAAAS
jgi:hypothetical protein